MSRDTNKAINNPWFWTWVGLLAVVLSVNGVFIYYAYDSNPGLVSNDYYERGQYYEENMVKRQLNAPEWELNIKHPDTIFLNSPATFVLANEGIVFDKVIFYAYRPSDAKADFSMPMTQYSDGHYQINASFPLKGKWDVLINAYKGEKNKNQPVSLFIKEK